MSDVVVAPHEEGWTVRHERCLFERFADRRSALRRASALAAALHRLGERAEVRLRASTTSSRRGRRPKARTAPHTDA